MKGREWMQFANRRNEKTGGKALSGIFLGLVGRADGRDAHSAALRHSKFSEPAENRRGLGTWMCGAAVGLLLVLSGCHLSAVESNKILVDTRGIPIVRVVIEGVGPGGENDLVPVTYERVIETGLFISDLPFFMFLWGVLLTGLFAYWVINKERKEHRATKTTVEKLWDQ